MPPAAQGAAQIVHVFYDDAYRTEILQIKRRVMPIERIFANLHPLAVARSGGRLKEKGQGMSDMAPIEHIIVPRLRDIGDFSVMRVLPAAAANDLAHPVHCSKTEQAFTASARSSLLSAAEAAGLRPAHGCRIGICKTCQCSKRSGTVENLRTGEISSEPDELIQLCISVARSPLELVL